MRAYERFLQYVRYHTTSDDNAPADKCPTTDRQKVLGAALAAVSYTHLDVYKRQPLAPVN